MKKKCIYILFLCFCSFLKIKAQGTNVSLNTPTEDIVNRYDIQFGKVLPSFHTGVRPYTRKATTDWAEAVLMSNLLLDKTDSFNLQYIQKDNTEWLEKTSVKSRKPLAKIFFPEEATFMGIMDKNKEYVFKLNPIAGLKFGRETDYKNTEYQYTKGVEVRGTISRHISFYTSITDNQVVPMQYVQRRVKGNFGKHIYHAIPGNGYWKEYKTVGFDYFDVRGYVSADFLRHFTVQFGHDKNFIGNGTRSLFLSDNSAPYLFLKLNTRVWKINYQNVYTELTSQYIRGADQLLPKKYAVFHHLSFAASKNVDIGLFESVVFSRKNQFELQYLNPIIFYRAIEQSVGSPDNSLIGADFKVNAFRTAQFYGQFLLDEFKFSEVTSSKKWWGNKYGYQLGAKYINVAGVNHLDWQGEINVVRPYTYTHSDSSSNYTHYNQELAHPLGANFVEIIQVVRYQPIPKLNLQLKYFNMRYGEDTVGKSFGSNIFYPTNGNTIPNEYGNTLIQGKKTTIHLTELQASYMLWHNLFADLNIIYRKSNSTAPNRNLNSGTVYGGVGIRWNLPSKSYSY